MAVICEEGEGGDEVVLESFFTRQVEALVKVAEVLNKIGSKSAADMDLASYLSVLETRVPRRFVTKKFLELLGRCEPAGRDMPIEGFEVVKDKLGRDPVVFAEAILDFMLFLIRLNCCVLGVSALWLDGRFRQAKQQLLRLR